MFRWRAAAAASVLVFASGFAQDSLADLDRRAAEAFDKRDCATASPLYRSALEMARSDQKWTQAALYARRIGICAYRAGDITSAYGAYTSGIQAAEKANDQEMLRENLHGSAIVLRHLGRHTEALAQAQRAYELAQACGHPTHFIQELSSVANLTGDIGQIGKAQQLDEQLLEYSRAHHDHSGEFTALENLGILYGELGQPDTGIRYVRETIATTPPTDHASLARLYTNLGEFMQGSGRLEEAQAANETALRYADAPEAWRSRHALLFNMSRINILRGRWAEAREQIEKSLREFAGRDPDLEAQARATLAHVLLNLHKPEEARDMAETAVSMARRSEVPISLVASLTAAGEVYDSIAKPQEAGAALDEATATLEAIRAAAPGDPAALEAILQLGYAAYQLQVRHAIAAGRSEAALVWAEKSKARVLNDILLKGRLNERSAMSEADIQNEHAISAKLARAAADPAKSREAINDLELFRRQLYSRHPQLALQRADFAPAGPAEWRKLLPDANSALLEYFVLPDGLALFVVRQNGVSVNRLDITPQALGSETARFRAQLAARDVNYAALARTLYSKLLAPAATRLAGTTRWILSPDGSLWELPFQALMDSQGKHVLETHAIDYTPSLTALWAIRQRRAHDSVKPGDSQSRLDLLAIGNPVNRAGALPDAEEEVRSIGRLYPAARTLVLTGADARPDRFREQAPRAAVIHIATHAGLNVLNPMYSTLQLSPGKDTSDAGLLTAGDLLRVPLHADVAVLSACETARGKPAQGEQLLGMGWALTGAGASASVISQWKVDSAATAQLMVAFHRFLQQPLAPSEALRRAALQVHDAPGNRNPFYWAGFLVLGDGFR